jgi:hypothetical protein
MFIISANFLIGPPELITRFGALKPTDSHPSFQQNNPFFKVYLHQGIFVLAFEVRVDEN